MHRSLIPKRQQTQLAKIATKRNHQIFAVKGALAQLQKVCYDLGDSGEKTEKRYYAVTSIILEDMTEDLIRHIIRLREIELTRERLNKQEKKIEQAIM